LDIILEAIVRGEDMPEKISRAEWKELKKRGELYD